MSRRRLLETESSEETVLPIEEQYLTITVTTAGAIQFSMPKQLTPETFESVSYSLNNGKSWTTKSNVTNGAVILSVPSARVGDKILWKGVGTDAGEGASYRATFLGTTAQFKVSGNPGSMVYGDDFINKAHGSKVRSLFANCTSVVDAKDLYLQSTGFYAEMFKNASNLEVAPDIIRPEGVSDWALSYFVSGCSNLTSIHIDVTGDVTSYGMSEFFHRCSKLSDIYFNCTGSISWNTASGFSTAKSSFPASGSATLGGGAYSYRSNLIPDGWTITEITN